MYCGFARTCDSPPSHGIDAARLLAATNSEDALKILNQAATSTTTFAMSSEASRLMSTLQSTVTTPAEVPPLRDYVNHMNMYQYMQNCLGTQSAEGDNKGSLGRFCTG